MFPQVDIDTVFADSGLKSEDDIIIGDTGLTKAYAEYFNDDNIDTLKAAAKLSLLQGWGGAFNQEFIDASDKFNQDFMGVSGSYTPEEREVRLPEGSFTVLADGSVRSGVLTLAPFGSEILKK